MTTPADPPAALDDVRVAAIDVGEEAELRAWHAVEAASIAHDRPRAVHRTYQALAAMVRHPSDHRRVVLLAATTDRRTIGTAELTLRDTENAHTLELQIHVDPGVRRRGVGRRLWQAADDVRRREGRTTSFGELAVPPDAALTFASGLGFASVHQEDHLALDLPRPPRGAPSPAAPGFEVVTWSGACPAELIDDYVGLRNQMEIDVPTGDVDLAAVVHTAERIRDSERRSARSYDRVTAAARHLRTGTLVGYSLVFLPHGSRQALQDDTLVLPAHRGHRLGLALKLATLAQITAAYPERTSLHTWTDPDNHAMVHTNHRFGYRPVERMHEVQLIHRPGGHEA